jgi:type I restriction enzyme S subunit
MSSVFLKDLCKSNEIGKYGIPAAAEEYCSTKIRYLRISDIDDNGNLTNNDIKSVSARDIEKYILKENDLVIARTGNSTGRAYFHESKNGRLAFAGFLIKYGLDDKKINPKYLKYYTISNEYKQWVKNLSVGSTRGNINAQTFANCPIILPERKQQNLLVSILSSLDAKIELNNRINTELEAMAKALYDYWFVQFDFPDDRGLPYRSSGGRMVWNEELKREVPEGWEVKRIKEIAKTGSGGTPLSTKEEYYNKGDIPWINSGEVNSSYIVEAKKFITKAGLENSSAKLFPRGTILMAMYGATAGQVSIMNIEAATNQAICAIMPIDSTTRFYLKFVLHDIYGYLVNLSSGSARDNLSQDKIRELELVMPKKDVLSQFHAILTPVFDKIFSNLIENRQLSSLRDWLLPMLMNGQVRVV